MTSGQTTSTASSRLSAALIVIVACLCFTQCSVFSRGEKVTKPRVHKSHYKKSSSKNQVGIGRFRFKVPNFERSGVKKVRMKG